MLEMAEERAGTFVNISKKYFYVFWNLIYVFIEQKHCTT
jgi:hypothetical protein